LPVSYLKQLPLTQEILSLLFLSSRLLLRHEFEYSPTSQYERLMPIAAHFLFAWYQKPARISFSVSNSKVLRLIALGAIRGFNRYLLTDYIHENVPKSFDPSFSAMSLPISL